MAKLLDWHKTPPGRLECMEGAMAFSEGHERKEPKTTLRRALKGREEHWVDFVEYAKVFNKAEMLLQI